MKINETEIEIKQDFLKLIENTQQKCINNHDDTKDEESQNNKNIIYIEEKLDLPLFSKTQIVATNYHLEKEDILQFKTILTDMFQNKIKLKHGTLVLSKIQVQQNYMLEPYELLKKQVNPFRENQITKKRFKDSPLCSFLKENLYEQITYQDESKSINSLWEAQIDATMQFNQDKDFFF